MKTIFILCIMTVVANWVNAKESINILSTSASANSSASMLACDNDPKTRWDTGRPQQPGQWISFILSKAVTIDSIYLDCKESAGDYPRAYAVYITVDPMNWGAPVAQGKGMGPEMRISFKPKYGNHVKIVQVGEVDGLFWSIHEIQFGFSDPDMQFDPAPDDIMSRPYMDASLPVKDRIDDLMGYMTNEDKMALLREDWGIPGLPHLKVPRVNKVEAIHGFSYSNGGPTSFPQSIALGATWNTELVREVGVAIGEETQAAGVQQAWSPVLDVVRDPRWGRCEETYGEDPYLVTEIGCAWIEGFQSLGLLATPKHFAGHGAVIGGRDSHDIGLSERELREIHLPPFREAVKRCEVESVMQSYGDWLDTVSAASTTLLKGILREEWGFDGFVVSDCGALRNMTSRKHYIVKNCQDAAALALAAGIATNCGDIYNCSETLDAARNGFFRQEDIDFTVQTLLRVMFRNGYFEKPPQSFDWNTIYEGWNSPEHQAVAFQAARECMTLLKNQNHLLPLSKNIKSIAVIGPNADHVQTGDYSVRPLENQLISVYEGIQAKLGDQVDIRYALGCDHSDLDRSRFAEAVSAAKNCEVAIVVVGDKSMGENENNRRLTIGENHDRASLTLPGVQQELVEAVNQTGTPVVLVVVSGRPYTVEYAYENIPAVLFAWFAGQASGTATADVLFGDYNPAGRLPVTIPRSTAQLPLYYNFKTSGRSYGYTDMPFYPRYRFGHGLSYTTFTYGNLRIEKQANGYHRISVDVLNTGDRTGDEVVQLYVTDMYASVRTPVMQLKGFDRIHLNPGQKKMVRFELTPYDISLLNNHMDRVVEPGEFKVMVGGVSPEYVASDRIKDSLKYNDTSEGTVGQFHVTERFAANFTYELEIDEPIRKDRRHTVAVRVVNQGNLTDVGEIKLYLDGQFTGTQHRFEIGPGIGKTLTLPFIRKQKGVHEIVLVGKYSQVSRSVIVQ